MTASAAVVFNVCLTSQVSQSYSRLGQVTISERLGIVAAGLFSSWMTFLLVNNFTALNGFDNENVKRDK